MAHHIIYVPGIGDHKTYNQDVGIMFWRLFGFIPHYFSLGWANPEGFDKKLTRLLHEIDELQNAGHIVSLVGVSAGASAVLIAYNERPRINKVICICGKIQRPNHISPTVYANNPDFKESMYRVEESLNKLKSKDLLKNILSLHPIRDNVVLLEDTKIPGAAWKTVPGWGHVSGIFMGIFAGAPLISKFLHSTKALL